MKRLQAYHTVLHLGSTLWLGCTLVVFSAYVLAKPLPIVELEKTLKPFVTDGCSMFPDGTVWDYTLWRDCCVAHDMAYWRGGDYWARMAADEALLACVDSVGEPAIGVAMLLGVRVGGSPFWPTAFKWGYGWEQWRGYQSLTLPELKLIEEQLVKQQLLKSSTSQLNESESENIEEK